MSNGHTGRRVRLLSTALAAALLAAGGNFVAQRTSRLLAILATNSESRLALVLEALDHTRCCSLSGGAGCLLLIVYTRIGFRKFECKKTGPPR